MNNYNYMTENNDFNSKEEIKEIKEINESFIVGKLDKLMKKVSIARRVSDNQPLIAPNGFITGVRRDKEADKLIINSKIIKANLRRISTFYTKESIMDLEKIYKEDFQEILSDFIIDELAYKIDKDFIEMVNDRAENKGSVVFDSSYDTAMDSVALSIIMRVNRGLSDLPISDNRSANGWAIVSSDIGALLSGIIVTSEDNKDYSPSYIGKIGGVDYYIDYTHANTAENSVLFGIKGNGSTRGSTIYSEYSKELIFSVNADDLQENYVLIDRTALSINPFDDEYLEKGEKSGFLGKLDVDLSALKIYQ